MRVYNQSLNPSPSALMSDLPAPIKIEQPVGQLEGGEEGFRTRNCSGDEGSKSPLSNLVVPSMVPSPTHAENTPNFNIDITAEIFLTKEAKK